MYVFPALETFLWYLATRRVFYTATEYPTKYCVLGNLSNILLVVYPIEYSVGYTKVPAGYPTFSIAYLIYSTSQYSKYNLRG